jgi:hypothetical protein
MTFLKSSHEGYLLVDHRASPGIPADKARQMGLDPAGVAEGQIYETATLTCCHCKIPVVKNPFRTRERGHCFKCNHYICDFCEAESRKPDYVHRPFAQVADMVASGRYVVTGHAPAPKLIKVTGD